jgi:hypothetical protein
MHARLTHEEDDPGTDRKSIRYGRNARGQKVISLLPGRPSLAQASGFPRSLPAPSGAFPGESVCEGSGPGRGVPPP